MPYRGSALETLAPRIESLVNELALAGNLDSEARAELRGHIEDKVRGYLSGEVPITGVDAILLAREHFGRPEELRSLFSHVYPQRSHASLVRLASAVIVLTSMVSFMSTASQYCVIQIGGLFFAATHYGPTSSGKGTVWFEWMIWLPLAVRLLGFFVCLVVLTKWRRELQGGSEPWFIRWPLANLVALSSLGIMTSVAPPLLSQFIPYLTYPIHSIVSGPSWVLGVSRDVALAESVIEVALCMWWVCYPIMRASAFMVGAILWFAPRAMLAIGTFSRVTHLAPRTSEYWMTMLRINVALLVLGTLCFVLFSRVHRRLAAMTPS